MLSSLINLFLFIILLVNCGLLILSDVVLIRQCHRVRLESIFLELGLGCKGLGLGSYDVIVNFNDLKTFSICKCIKFKTFLAV